MYWREKYTGLLDLESTLQVDTCANTQRCQKKEEDEKILERNSEGKVWMKKLKWLNNPRLKWLFSYFSILVFNSGSGFSVPISYELSLSLSSMFVSHSFSLSLLSDTISIPPPPNDDIKNTRCFAQIFSISHILL